MALHHSKGSSFLFLLLVLCLTSGCIATTTTAHRCGFDDLMNETDAQPIEVVKELPRKGQGSWQAYTLSRNQGAQNWSPIRIKVFTKDLENESRYCTAEGQDRPSFMGYNSRCRDYNLLTPRKKNVLEKRIIGGAVKLHAERLLVQPVAEPLRVPEFDNRTLCRHFTVPAEHHTTGVRGADMVLYVAAGPERTFGVPCVLDGDQRPVAGAINIAPVFFDDRRHAVRLAAHEIAHALGFGYDKMKALNMVKTHRLNGSKPVVVVNSTNVVAKAREHFNCNETVGLQLEKDRFKTMDLSHWDPRFAKDELMSGVFTLGYYTALTMAVFADLGFYQVNWTMAEPMKWGRNAGCGYFTNNCSTETHPEMYCNLSKKITTCTSDRTSLGACIGTLGEVMEGQMYLQQENCPIRYPFSGSADWEPFSSYCGVKGATHPPGSLTGRGSWCLDAESLNVTSRRRGRFRSYGGVCAKVRCMSNNTLKVKYLGNELWHDCPEGGFITPTGPHFQAGGKIKCPNFDEVCTITSDGASLLGRRLHQREFGDVTKRKWWTGDDDDDEVNSM